MKKEKPQIQCPNCKAYKTMSMKTVAIVSWLFLGTFMMFIPPIGLLFWILAIVSIFIPSKKRYCTACHFKFEI